MNIIFSGKQRTERGVWQGENLNYYRPTNKNQHPQRKICYGRSFFEATTQYHSKIKSSRA